MDEFASDEVGSSGSFSERQLMAAEAEEYEDPLPGVEGLQISGEAYPGRLLVACGFTTNGASVVEFAWVRYSENGSASYIEGQSKPTYLVNADDIGHYLAVEVIPIDDREIRGEVVRSFANEHRKICCDAKMQEQIERFFFSEHASFEATVTVYQEGQKVRMEIKRKGFRVWRNGSLHVKEKFSPKTAITIPAGNATGFLIHCTNGNEYLLSADGNSFLRDVIVLTMRLFIVRALKKQKRKKCCLFL